MTQAVYLIGGAGTGKSTFMQQLLDRIGMPLGPLEDLHAKANVKNVVTLRGHAVGSRGIYLGCMRDSFPGTDGLDRASSPVGAEWLDSGMHSVYDFVVGEGATLATRPFLAALQRNTELLVVHLWAEDFLKDLRFLERGSNQDPRFVAATATRSANLAADLSKAGVRVLTVDSGNPSSWNDALETSWRNLLAGSKIMG